MLRRLTGTTLLAVLFTGAAAGAHHSFAVFFDDSKSIEIRGAVTEFRFTNPHAIIAITGARTSGGAPETWRAETNAVTLLRRRGWTATSLKPGDIVTIEGWPSRDGRNYIRVRRVVRADGVVLGAPPAGPGTDPSGEKK